MSYLNVIMPNLSRALLKQIVSKHKFLEEIVEDNSPTESVALLIEGILKPGERYVYGYEYVSRFKSFPNLAGLSQALWLEENFQKFPGLIDLWKFSLDFPGTVVANCDGSNLFIPILVKDGEFIDQDWRLISNNNRSFATHVARYILQETTM